MTWLEGVERLEDPDHGPAFAAPPTGVVVHATAGGSGRATAGWARDTPQGRSWHLLLERDGTLYQQVPLTHQAWHAGRSSWAGRADLNAWTVGVELANHLLLERAGDTFFSDLGGRRAPYHGPTPVHGVLRFDGLTPTEGWWEPYPEAQLRALDALLGRLAALGLGTQLVGHDEVAVPAGRKLDPGPLFPWELFRRWRPDAPRFR